jgi:hypothetical protein
MSDYSETIERALSTAEACILPALFENFDSQSLSLDDFSEYRVMAKEQLYLLLDILHQNQNLLTDHPYDNRLIQLKVNVLRLACEQSDSNSLFHIADKILQRSLEKITCDHVGNFEDAVFGEYIQIYKDVFKRDVWKKQIGLIYSSPMMCSIINRFKPQLISDDNLMFFLSIGSNLVAHFEPHYKEIGLNIYRHLLKCNDVSQLKELNIHDVIYSEVYPLIQRSDTLNFNSYLYQCLYDIVLMENERVNSSRWCKYDEVMAKLLSQFSLGGTVELCRLLAYEIIRFCRIGSNGYEVGSQESLLLAMNQQNYFENLRSVSREPNHRAQRWIKTLVELMIRESFKLQGDQNDCIFFLDAFHTIYIVTIFTIESTSFQKILSDFTRKFILAQIRAIRKSNGNDRMLESVHKFLSTVEQHQHYDPEITTVIAKIKTHDLMKIKSME